MSKFKDMKIKTGTPEHCKKVQEALFAAGYKWQNAAPTNAIHIDDAAWLFTYSQVGEITYDHNQQYGVRHHNEEYVLGPQGTLISAKEYFKKPATAPLEAYCKGCNVLTCVGCGEASPAESSFEERVVKALMSDDPLPKETPAPLLPRVEHSKQRLLALLHAAIGYVENGEAIPEEVRHEVEDISEFLEAHYES